MEVYFSGYFFHVFWRINDSSKQLQHECKLKTGK
jgi:hypothetical protein